MVKEKLGVVTEDEKEEILKIYERRLALNEVFMTISNPSIEESTKEELYQKVIADLGQTKLKFDLWWQNISTKYKWKIKENGQWQIDFENREIYLVYQE